MRGDDVRGVGRKIFARNVQTLRFLDRVGSGKYFTLPAAAKLPSVVTKEWSRDKS
jgi:hypothetical protein